MVEVNSFLIEDTVEEDASGLLLQASIINPGDSVLPSYKDTESCSFQGTTAGSCVLALDFPWICWGDLYIFRCIDTYLHSNRNRNRKLSRPNAKLGSSDSGKCLGDFSAYRIAVWNVGYIAGRLIVVVGSCDCRMYWAVGECARQISPGTNVDDCFFHELIV
jgi:hypothetical protein